MADTFTPAELDCPDPDNCPLPESLPRLRTYSLNPQARWYRVYDATWGYDEHNPGHGDARFSPIDDPTTGARLPSMYLAATPTAALLETVFHSVHHDSDRIIYQRHLRGKLLAHLHAPTHATLADLRNPQLQRLGLHRNSIVATPAEHYPCTRRLAMTALQQSPTTIDGLIWHSRQAELADHQQAEVVILYGHPRYNSTRGSWKLFGPGATSLYDGPGRLLLDDIAHTLHAVIEPDDQNLVV